MALRRFVFLTVWMNQVLTHFTAENKCYNKLINNINITTELQSYVLLPCFFDPTLLGSDQTADIAAVWSHRNITTDNLLEISLQGDVRFWKNRGGRLKSFSKLSKSGNFSILLKDVQQSDLGLYRCELFEGIDCSIAYQELLLKAAEAVDDSLFADGVPTWFILAGALGGIVLLTLLLISYSCAKPSNDSSDQSVYKFTLDNPMYDTFQEPQPNNSAKADNGIPSDIPVYAIIKKGKRAPNKKRNLEEVLL